MEMRGRRSRYLTFGLVGLTVVMGILSGLDQFRSPVGAPEPLGAVVSAGVPSESGDKPLEQPGLSINDPRAFPGYTLLAPMNRKRTFLIDMEGRVVKIWQSRQNPALGAVLLPGGRLLRAASETDHPFAGVPGAGGLVQELDWDGRLVWDYRFGNEHQRPHHEAIKLPNGNVLMIVWDRKTAEEAVAAGRQPTRVRDGMLQADGLIEVKSTGPTTGEVVWEWHLWDHLIQDHNPDKANYGDVAAHPERVDVNFEESAIAALMASQAGIDKLRSIGYLASTPSGAAPQRVEPDWTHVNSVDYNPELDQIAIGVHAFSEVWIIDHGTSTAEAASHTGGRAGKGGDLLYRWGNPIAYRAGLANDRRLFHQHNAHWIPRGLPGAGHLLVFNNGMHRPGGEYSSVDEIVLPTDSQGHYLRPDGQPFGPAGPIWSYTAPRKSDFYSSLISGAQRLPNGNTLICSGNDGTVFEVTTAGEVVWKYVQDNLDDAITGDVAATDGPLLSLADPLALTDEQRRSLGELQRDVDATLKATLTGEQQVRLAERASAGAASFAPPGQFMAVSTRILLKLTPAQKAKIDRFQEQIDRKLGGLLTVDQQTRLKQLRDDFARGVRGGSPGGGPVVPGEPVVAPAGGNGIFRAYRYGASDPALAGKDLGSGPRTEGARPPGGGR